MGSEPGFLGAGQDESLPVSPANNMVEALAEQGDEEVHNGPDMPAPRNLRRRRRRLGLGVELLD